MVMQQIDCTEHTIKYYHNVWYTWQVISFRYKVSFLQGSDANDIENILTKLFIIIESMFIYICNVYSETLIC